MNHYVWAGVAGGFVSLYVCFWVFYGPDSKVLKEFRKDVLQNSPFKSLRDPDFQRFTCRMITTDSRITLERVAAYPTALAFWIKLVKHFALGVIVAIACLHILYNY
jgi:hypothetical protein